MHINEFVAAVGNPAKMFLWDVVIPGLPALTGIRAQTGQVPGVGNTDIDLFHMGQMAKFAGAVEYEHTWAVTIVESEGGDIYNALYQWQQLVNNQADGIGGDPIVYKRDIIFTALTSKGNPWMTKVIKNAYPKNIDTIDMDKAANTEAFKWGVTFNFDWWE